RGIHPRTHVRATPPRQHAPPPHKRGTPTQGGPPTATTQPGPHTTRPSTAHTTSEHEDNRPREVTTMTTPPSIADLSINQLDAVIALTHADLTWCSPQEAQATWNAINTLLDRRNQLTHRATQPTMMSTPQRGNHGR